MMSFQKDGRYSVNGFLFHRSSRETGFATLASTNGEVAKIVDGIMTADRDSEGYDRSHDTDFVIVQKKFENLDPVSCF